MINFKVIFFSNQAITQMITVLAPHLSGPKKYLRSMVSAFYMYVNPSILYDCLVARVSNRKEGISNKKGILFKFRLKSNPSNVRQSHRTNAKFIKNSLFVCLSSKTTYVNN